MRKVFEIDPILCHCGAQMHPVAVITQDCELERLLRNQGIPTAFPKTAPARSPPRSTDDGTQVDPRVELWEGIAEGPQPDWAAA